MVRVVPGGRVLVPRACSGSKSFMRLSARTAALGLTVIASWPERPWRSCLWGLPGVKSPAVGSGDDCQRRHSSAAAGSAEKEATGPPCRTNRPGFNEDEPARSGTIAPRADQSNEPPTTAELRETKIGEGEPFEYSRRFARRRGAAECRCEVPAPFGPLRAARKRRPVNVVFAE